MLNCPIGATLNSNKMFKCNPYGVFKAQMHTYYQYVALTGQNLQGFKKWEINQNL